MEKVKKELEQAFKFLSAIPVSGDAVEVMAMAKEKLRKAYFLLERKGENDGGQNNRGTATISADK